jgi:carnitine-CoA ligase
MQGNRLGDGDRAEDGATGADAGSLLCSGQFLSISKLLLWSVANYPDAVALEFEDGLSLSRRDLLSLSCEFAGRLGLLAGPGEPIAIAMENRAEFLVAVLGAIWNGSVVVPMNPAASDYERRYVLSDSEPVVLVTDAPSGSQILAIARESHSVRAVVRCFGEEPNGLLRVDHRGLSSSPSPHQARVDECFGIWYTSGSTGLPKGCMVSHEWALRITRIAMELHPVGPEDRIFVPLQFYYADVLLGLLRALACGGTLVAVRHFSVSRFWEAINRRNVSVLSTIASMPNWLLKQEPNPLEREHSVRFAVHAAIPRAQHRELEERFGFPWYENYGMMEAGIIARVPQQLGPELVGSGSVGPAAPGVSVRIVDEDSDPLRPGVLTAGEIQVRAPGMFLGYVNDRARFGEMMDGDWLRTGDIGRIDHDGNLYVTGRKKEVIRRSGQNVSAAEVEAVIRAHPDVRDVAVVGTPDAEREEEISAYVLLTPRGSMEEARRLVELARFCGDHLSGYKVPRYWEAVADFEYTASMRVRKDALRRAGHSEAVWDAKSD